MVKALTLGLAMSSLIFAQEFNLGHYKLKYVKSFTYADSHTPKGKETGTIKGKVVYVGERKLKNKRKLITKDKEVCGKGYKIDKVYVISPEGGVKNAVLFIKELKGKAQETKTLVQRKCEFHPRVLSLTAGSTLRIVNEDPVKHEATGVQDFETIFKFAQPKQGMSDEVKLNKPGIVEITCSIHGWMKAWAVVSPNPYHAVSKEDGSFEIKGVPAGKYTLKLWHEGFGEKEKTVEVKPGETTEVVFELR